MNELIYPPKLMTIIPTFKCTAECLHCCFGCNPRTTKRLSNEELFEYINEAITLYSSIKLIVISGGECFLLGNDLFKLIEYIHGLGLKTRVVTNGYWANSKKEAEKTIDQLICSGLTEINFSTGDEHNMYVPIERVITGSVTAAEKGIENIFIAVEGGGKEITTEKILLDSTMKHHNETNRNKVSVTTNIWVDFEKDVEPTNKKKMKPKGCKAILTSVQIDPKSDMLACCGIAVTRLKHLTLGNLKENRMNELHDVQFRDFVKIWLSYEGPAEILSYITGKSYEENHPCYYCYHLLNSEENIEKLRNVSIEKIKKVLYDYKIKKEIETLN